MTNTNSVYLPAVEVVEEVGAGGPVLAGGGAAQLRLVLAYAATPSVSTVARKLVHPVHTLSSMQARLAVAFVDVRLQHVSNHDMLQILKQERHLVFRRENHIKVGNRTRCFVIHSHKANFHAKGFPAEFCLFDWKPVCPLTLVSKILQQHYAGRAVPHVRCSS